MKLVETLALAERIATGASPHSGREAALALALLTMETALASCRANDRSPIYTPGEARRDGARPAAIEGAAGRWLTPREIVELVAVAPPAPPATDNDAAAAALAVERANQPDQPGVPE